EAHATLHHALVATAQLLAPFAPFLSDELYVGLTGEASVHLSDWPEPGDAHDPALAAQMAARPPPRGHGPGRPHRRQGAGAPAAQPGHAAAPGDHARRRGGGRGREGAQRE